MAGPIRALAAVLALVLTWPALALTAPTPAPPVAYRLEPDFKNGALIALVVDIRFQGDAGGETRLNLPDHWASEHELWKRVVDLKIEGANSVTAPSPEVRMIKAAPSAPLHVRYRVLSGYDADPAVGPGNPFKPIIRPAWFEFHGETVFAFPGSDVQRPATFAWGRFPKRWVKASDLEHGAMGRPMTLYDIVESIALGGPDVRLVSRRLDGGLVRVAMRGDWKFKDDDFADLIIQVIGAQRGFWKDIHDPYLITLIPLAGGDANNHSLGGTGRTDAFALYATGDAEGAALRRLLAHENMHTWIPRRIGGMPDKEEATDYWLSEGFTDFYAYRTLLRSGVWSLDDFAKTMNDALKAYGSSPVREAPNSVIVRDFWKSDTTEKLPYQRGMLLAFLWDARLKAATGGARGLDDVMLAMRDKAQGLKPGETGPIATTLLPTVYAALGGGDLKPEIDSHIIAGAPILLPADLFGDCATIDSKVAPRFDRGWDPDATSAAGSILTGLRDDSPAYAAGLRNGMKLLKREFGSVGDASVEYGVRVVVDGKEQVFRFMPVGKGQTTIQSVVLAPGLDQAGLARCARRMSGT